jgi:hypothetical protein
MGLGGGIGAMAGHVTDKAPVYTARWLPGPNKEDLLIKYEAAKNTAAAIAQTPEIPQPLGVALTEMSQPPAQAEETEVFTKSEEAPSLHGGVSLTEIPIVNE